MSKLAWAVMVCTLFALTAASLWVPMQPVYLRRHAALLGQPAPPRDYLAEGRETLRRVQYRWAWDRSETHTNLNWSLIPRTTHFEVQWWLLGAELLLIALIGVGLLALAPRRAQHNPGHSMKRRAG